MTDRELLEAAAKAAGYGNFRESAEVWSYRCDGHGGGVYWNPLDDDGDALRLAVKLRMSVDVDEHEASTYAYAGASPRVYAMEMWRGDVQAATRRAIVRAAAAEAAHTTPT